ncbi:MAG: hypothetical protein JW870_18795 [Candidatus Delongbacteria bacterium]|nr:hypothetical protein [Candidatus Delongbacteria bacterium]
MEKKKKMPINLRVLLIILIIMILCGSYYAYKYIKFDKKVRKFNEDIILGMTVSEVIKILGKPTYIVGYQDVELISDRSNVNPNINIDECCYNGAYFLRESLLLYFNSETNTLIFKERGRCRDIIFD